MAVVQTTNQGGLSWLAVRAVATLIALLAGRFLYRGYQQRKKVKTLISQGIRVMPHSWLTGHIQILNAFRTSHPADISFYLFHSWLSQNARKYFPDLDGKIPGVVYLDLWPLTYSYALVFDAEAGSQFTVTQNLKKHDVVHDYLVLMTQGHDLFSGNGQLWKTWRSRLNPGFSARHMATLLPEILEEVTTFVDILKGKAGTNGSWGSVFSLEPTAVSLTFDVITRTILDIRLNDQTTEGGHPLKVAMVDQIKLMSEAFVSFKHHIPFTRSSNRLKQIENYNHVVRGMLLPHIEEKINGESQNDKKKTSLDLALKHIDKDSTQAGLGPKQLEFVDQLISNLKIMMFAGHDTTAITICMMFKCLQDNPKSLEHLRAEHDSILGPDPQSVAQALTENPHLIHSLPYTLAVIKETLRLYPIASTVREGTPDCVLSPRGDSNQYPTDGWAPWAAITAIQRDPTYWPRPDEFLPERWTVEADHPLHPILKHAWLAFAIGPRNCIGMELALTELKLVSVLTARVLEIREAWEEWDIQQGTQSEAKEMVNGNRMYMTGSGTMHPKDGLPVCVKVIT